MVPCLVLCVALGLSCPPVKDAIAASQAAERRLKVLLHAWQKKREPATPFSADIVVTHKDCAFKLTNIYHYKARGDGAGLLRIDLDLGTPYTEVCLYADGGIRAYKPSHGSHEVINKQDRIRLEDRLKSRDVGFFEKGFARLVMHLDDLHYLMIGLPVEEFDKRYQARLIQEDDHFGYVELRWRDRPACEFCWIAVCKRSGYPARLDIPEPNGNTKVWEIKRTTLPSPVTLELLSQDLPNK